MVSDAAVEGISGALGGMVALTATYPLSTINTLQSIRGKQKQAHGGSQGGAKSNAAADIVQICKDSGWRGLFAGIEPSLLGTAVSQGVYYYFYSGLRQLAVRAANSSRPRGAAPAADIGIGPSLAVAALAGCGNTLLTLPIWVVATRMQAHRSASRSSSSSGGGGGGGHEDDHGFVGTARELYQDSGIAGFWKGLAPALVMVSNPTVQYMLYEWLLARRSRQRAAQALAPAKPSAWEVFRYASLAKLGATLITYPLLLVKTRMQSARRGSTSSSTSGGSGTGSSSGSGGGGGGGSSSGGPVVGGTLETIRSVYEHEGLLGFYAGMHTKIVQSILAAALLFLTKEEISEAVRRVLKGTPPPRHAAVALARA